MRILAPPPIDTEAVYQVFYPAPLPDSGDDRFDWDDLFARVGWRHPADYRSFVETYGAGGGISDVLYIESPPPVDAEYRGASQWNDPAREGLRMWGADDVGNLYYWRCTDDDPDLWTVVVLTGNPHREENVFDYPMGMVDFLIALVSDTLDAPFLNLHTRARSHIEAGALWIVKSAKNTLTSKARSAVGAVRHRRAGPRAPVSEQPLSVGCGSC